MPDSRFNDKTPNPLYLVEGSRLTPETKSGSRYSFQHIPMKDVAVLEYPDGFSLDDLSEKQLKKFFPNEYNQAVVFSKIGDCGLRNGLNDGNGGVADWTEVSGKPSGFITPVGTLVPQIIVPWYTSKNQVYFQNPVYPQTLYPDPERCTDWLATAPYDLSGVDVNYSSEINTYGLYDSFLNAKDFGNGDSSSYTRVYKATGIPSMWAFALLVDIVRVHPNTSDKNPAFVEMKLYGSDSDTIIARFYQKGTVTLSVYRNGEGVPNTVSGSLSFTEMSQKTTQCRSSVILHKNAVFFYTLLNRLIVTGDLTTNSEQTSKAISVVRNPNLNLMSISDPAVDQFPAKHKEDGVNYIYVNSSSARFRLGDTMQVTWKNCLGSFALSKVRFCPRVRFSFFYRMDGTTTSNNDGMGDYSDYFCLEVGGKTGDFGGLTSRSYAKKIFYDSERDSTVYRADFDIDAGYTMTKYPFEILGLIHVVKRKGRITDIMNDDGNFAEGFDRNIDGKFETYRKGAKLDNEGESWIDYVTNVSVSHTLDGTSGSMTLDKYMMMSDLSARPQQSIGAVTLCGRNIVKYGERRSGYSPYSTLPDGQFFKGYAIETTDSQSSGGSDLSISLVGIQKKLSDMKLVNVPYWDGDRFFGKNDSDIDAVMNYFISYSGCDLRYVNEFSIGTQSGDDDVDRRSDIILPRSFDYKSPAVHFNMGTSCLEGIKEISRMINHQFVIQPDGRGYFYGLDSYGCPVWINKGPIRWTYDESDILSLRLAPFLDNKYNTFLTLSLIGTNSHRQGGVIPEGTAPGMKLSEYKRSEFPVPERYEHYPWSRIITNRENGILTKSQLNKFHRINVSFGRSRMFTGSITVPGRNEFFLFDKIRINHDKTHDDFYIYGITHNINMQTKEWTTELQIADFDVDKR